MVVKSETLNKAEMQKYRLNELHSAMGGLYNARYATEPLSPEFSEIVQMQDLLQKLITKLEKEDE